MKVTLVEMEEGKKHVDQLRWSLGRLDLIDDGWDGFFFRGRLYTHWSINAQ